MESVSKYEYVRVLSELDMLMNKFVALHHENQMLLGDLQQVSTEKAQQYEELSQRVHQLEESILSLREQVLGAKNSPREPKISLPAKFDGMGSFFRGFLNQVRLVIPLHPNRYLTDAARVGLVGTLLCGTTLAWFAPLLEKKSPLLEDFEAFVKEFQASFGDTNNTRRAVERQAQPEPDGLDKPEPVSETGRAKRIGMTVSTRTGKQWRPGAIHNRGADMPNAIRNWKPAAKSLV